MTDSPSAPTDPGGTPAQVIFLDALEQPPARRAAWIVEACGGDGALRAEVESLLAAHEGGGPVGEWGAAAVAPDHPRRVGDYQIVQRIGEGGMGAVYLAERLGEGFRQRVALKLLRAGWADPLLADRLTKERAILARLEHPGIARLVDGGVTEAGQPYLAMEFVEGTGLLDYTREQQLTVAERVALFGQVCDALHYAHQQLVVHRDLKPGNIMVGTDGRVRLLDFGIATIVDPDCAPTEGSRTHSWLTPAYASPEQVRGKPVSTASDIYSLGVLLYELLTGARPYTVDGASPAEIERLVVDTMPPRPNAQAELPPALRRRLSGDLDTIVLKAMAKEPDRRYDSAAALGADLRRHLQGMPVQARPASLVYRTGKFVRRHATAVVAATLVLGALVTGGLVALRQATVARRERDVAASEAERAARVSALLLDLFRSSDPSRARGDDVTARELLDQGTARIDREFGDRPDLQASLFSEVGRIYANLGLLDRAESLVRRAVSLEVARGEDRSLQGSAMLAHLGRIYAAQGQRDSAIATLRRAIAVRGELLALPDTILAQAQADLAWELRATGDHEAAGQLFTSALETERRVRGGDAPAVASLLVGLAATLHDAGRFDQADSLLQEILDRQDADLTRPHPQAATAFLTLGMLRRFREEYIAAEPYLRSALQMRTVLYDPGHPDRLEAEVEWSLDLIELGRYREANAQITSSYAAADSALGGLHPTTESLREALAYARSMVGRATEALPLIDTTLRNKRVRFGGDHPAVVNTILRAAEVAMAANRPALAATRFDEARAMAERTAGPESTYRMLALTGLARVAMGRGELARAAAQLEEAAGIGARTLRPDHRYVLALDRERARLDLLRGNRAAARSRLEAVLIGERKVRPAGHPRIVETEEMLNAVSGER